MQKKRRKMRFFREEVGGDVGYLRHPSHIRRWRAGWSLTRDTNRDRKGAGASFQGAREDVRFMALPA